MDAFVEGVHFRLATTSMRDLGHRCLAASVSDLAAMGAEPGRGVLRARPARTARRARVLELTDGAEALAAELGMTICGGDLTACAELFVSSRRSVTPTDEDRLAYAATERGPGDRVGSPERWAARRPGTCC